jgi:uncharacterized protein (TIGR04255 family)
MQYENNYLKNVIFRIDFAKPLSRSKQLVDSFSNLVKPIFPKKDNVTHTIMQAQILTQKDGNRVTQSTQKVTDYRFADENQEKILMLEPSSDINLVFSIYKNSKELKEIIGLIIDSVIKVYGDIKIKRTGLRYINDIVLPEGSPFEWGPFINRSLISSLDFLPENTNLSRSMGIIELNREDHKVLFQFGMYNPEYPNKIARKIFALDYDCYTTTELSASEIKERVEILQKDEEKLFESSIEEGLRKKMGVVIDDRISPN